jgi:hypothetical protein
MCAAHRVGASAAGTRGSTSPITSPIIRSGRSAMRAAVGYRSERSAIRRNCPCPSFDSLTRRQSAASSRSIRIVVPSSCMVLSSRTLFEG